MPTSQPFISNSTWFVLWLYGTLPMISSSVPLMVHHLYFFFPSGRLYYILYSHNVKAHMHIYMFENIPWYSKTFHDIREYCCCPLFCSILFVLRMHVYIYYISFQMIFYVIFNISNVLFFVCSLSAYCSCRVHFQGYSAVAGATN